MEEEEEAIGYLDKVLEDEDDSEPGTPTSPGSPFSAGEKVGGRGNPAPLLGSGGGTRGILLVMVMRRSRGSFWVGVAGAVAGVGLGGAAGASPQTHCPHRTACGGGHRTGLHQTSGAKGSVGACAEWGKQPAFLPWGSGGHVCCWGGGCVAQQDWHRMLRKGLDHTLPLPHRTATGKPLNGPKPWCFGGDPGGPLC